jgi:hypothetical protein
MTFEYKNFGDTINFAEDLGWHNWLDDIDDNDAQPGDVDVLEEDALDYIFNRGYEIITS